MEKIISTEGLTRSSLEVAEVLIAYWFAAQYHHSPMKPKESVLAVNRRKLIGWYGQVGIKRRIKEKFLISQKRRIGGLL